MRPFLYGRRFDTAIFDLDQTAAHLRRALNFTAHLASKGGLFLFVSRQPHMTHLVERSAIECGEYAHTRQWRTELFTAPRHLFKGTEVRLPDALIVLHTREGVKYTEHLAVRDAAKVGIPTLAIVDSDCNPNLVTYPVPGNDDSVTSVQLYLHLFKQAILIGKKHAEDSDEARMEEESNKES